MNQPQTNFLPVNTPPPPILMPGGRIEERLLAEAILSGDPEAGQDSDPAFAGLAGQWHAEGSHQMAPEAVPGDSPIYHMFAGVYDEQGRARMLPDEIDALELQAQGQWLNDLIGNVIYAACGFGLAAFVIFGGYLLARFVGGFVPGFWQ